jgi:hypothetical protein
MSLLIWAAAGFIVGRVLRAIYDDLTMPEPQWMPYISNIGAPSVAELNAGVYLDATPGEVSS